MQPYTKIELSVGAFVILGALALSYLSFTLGNLSPNRRHFALHARFANVGELKQGAPVKVAGVNIGEVKRIQLVDYAAEVELALDDHMQLPSDTIASIQSAGLLGDAFVALSAGAAEQNLASGARISRTESAMNLMDLIQNYALGSPLSEEGDKKKSKRDERDKSPTLETHHHADPVLDELE